AAPAALDKILSSLPAPNGGISLESALTAVDGTWKRKCLEDADSRIDDLAPIHRALRRSVEGTAWVKSFEAATGIKVKKPSFKPVTVATQMYNERLLQKAARG